MVRIIANREGLLSLSKQLKLFAESEDRSYCYEEFPGDLEEGSLTLEIDKAERSAAPWLWMCSTAGKVPVCGGQSDFRHGVVHASKICPTQEPKEPIYARPFRWGARHFFSGSNKFGCYELFCSDLARKMLERAAVPMDYLPVLNEKTERPIPDLFCMKPRYTLPAEAICLENGRLNVRPGCLDPACKLYAAPRNCGLQEARPAMLVSCEVYEFLQKWKMDRGLRFTPACPEEGRPADVHWP